MINVHLNKIPKLLTSIKMYALILKDPNNIFYWILNLKHERGKKGDKV